MRHAEAESQEKEARLSERGRLQAELAALRLLEELWGNRSPVQFYYSPVWRAVETHRIMTEVIRLRDPEREILSSEQDRVGAGGVIGPLMKAGIPYEQTVEYWLRNPESVPDKEPSAVARRIGDFVGSILDNPLHQVVVAITHEIPLAAILHEEFGFQENRCSVNNCEWIRISDPGGDKDAVAVLRGQVLEPPEPPTFVPRTAVK